MNKDRNAEQYRYMTETPVHKLIITLGVPTIISTLISTIYNLADTYFVGSISTSASGAVGIVFSLMAVIQAFGFMYGHGSGTNLSKHLGMKDIETGKRYAATGFYLSLLSGLIITILGLLFLDPFMRLLGSTETILPYSREYGIYILLAAPLLASSCVLNNLLRYEGKAFFAMIGLCTGGLLNIFGDFILINIFHLGVTGAGISTAVSQLISFIILLVPFLRKITITSFHPKYITLKKEVILRIFYNGSPSLIRQGLQSVSGMFLNHIAGLYGDAAIAALSIMNRITNFLFCVTIGLGQGLQPVSAFNFGAKFYSRVKDAFWFGLKLSVVLVLILGVFSFGFAEQLITLFRDDPEVIMIGTKALRYECLILPAICFSTFANMLFQSIGQGKIAAFLASLRSGLCLIPSLFILTSLFGLTGLQLTYPVSDLSAGLISVYPVMKFLKNLPEDGMDLY